MNLLDLSPAAQVFWGSIIRHLLTAIGSLLVAHGYVTKEGASAYVEELVGLAVNGLVIFWANREHYWAIVRQIVARSMPAGTTATQVVEKVEALKAVDAVPSVFPPKPDGATPIFPEASRLVDQATFHLNVLRRKTLAGPVPDAPAAVDAAPPAPTPITTLVNRLSAPEGDQP